MRLRHLELLFALLATSARAAGVDFGLAADPATPPVRTAPRTFHPIEVRALDPLQVIPVPVAVDRLTTIRFPGPISDLVSALVSTERHPQALFLLTFQSGEAFFSVQALRTNVSTSLNVVWRAQTYVLELEASPTPVLSLVLTNPPTPRLTSKSPILPASRTPDPAPPDTPWRRYQAVAEREPSLRSLFPRGMQSFRQHTVGQSAETPLYGFRLEDVLAFPEDAVVVARLTIANRSPVAVDPNTWRLDFSHQGREVRIHHIDRPGPIPPFDSRTLFATLALPPVADTGHFATNLLIRVSRSHVEPSSGTPHRP